MKLANFVLALAFIASTGLLGAVAQDPAPVKDANSAVSEKPPKRVGLANPASVNCAKKGGKLEIRKGRKGEYGVCKFPNGKECEEWALFRGKCSPEKEELPPADKKN
jgi:uncharacterized protein